MHFLACLQSLGVTMAVFIGVQFMPLLATRAEATEQFVVLGPIMVYEGGETPDLTGFRKSRFDTDLLAGVGGEAAIEASEDSVVKIGGKELRWTPAITNDGVVDLDKTLGRHEWSVAYAYAKVEADEAKQIVLGLGSNDSIRVWLNGKLVYSKWAGRPLIVDQDLVPVKVHKGENRLLVKIVNWSLGSAFSCRPVPGGVLSSTLARAVFRGDHESLEMLLGHGVSPESETALGIKPIQIAKIYGDRVDDENVARCGCQGPRTARRSVGRNESDF